MSVTATYGDTNGRVTINATGLSTAATVALVERSSDGGATYTTVRGASAVPVTAGTMTQIRDYEFAAGALNTYRVRTRYAGPPVFVSAGTAAHADNASVIPGLPAGFMAGDLLLVLAAIRNSGTGLPNLPTGYTLLGGSGGNARLYGKIAVGNEAAGPTITFASGIAGATCSAQMAAFRGTDMTTSAVAALLNASAVNIAFPSLLAADVPENATVIYAGWRQQDWTSVATIAGTTEIGEPSTGLGDNQGLVWDYVIRTTPAAVGAGSFVVTGGVAGISRGITLALSRRSVDPVIDSQTGTVTPALTQIWLKSLTNPTLNAPLLVVDFSAITRASRTEIFEVVGSPDPIAVTEVMGSPAFVINPYTSDATKEAALDALAAVGGPLFLHIPAGWRVPGGYVVAADEVSRERTTPRGQARVWEIPLRVVRAPGPDVTG